MLAVECQRRSEQHIGFKEQNKPSKDRVVGRFRVLKLNMCSDNELETDALILEHAA